MASALQLPRDIETGRPDRPNNRHMRTERLRTALPRVTSTISYVPHGRDSAALATASTRSDASHPDNSPSAGGMGEVDAARRVTFWGTLPERYVRPFRTGNVNKVK
jgi:hypothetical protein